MDFFTAMQVSASGLSAQRTRMNVASSNLANVSTTHGPDGGPYRRRDVVLTSRPAAEAISGGRAGGSPSVYEAAVKKIQQDKQPPRLEYDPGHPDANPDGYVAYPNVSAVEEMVDMITASRAYQAGVTALESAVSLAERAIGIGK